MSLTFQDIGLCGCGCGCFGCEIPASSLTATVTVDGPGGSSSGSGTLAFLGANTSLSWAWNSTTSQTGCCWSASFGLSGAGGTADVQIVCSPGCTACDLVISGTNWIAYASTMGGDISPTTGPGDLSSVSCTPLSIVLVVGGRTTVSLTITP